MHRYSIALINRPAANPPMISFRMFGFARVGVIWLLAKIREALDRLRSSVHGRPIFGIACSFLKRVPASKGGVLRTHR
jgi:hypothetical protein